MTDVRIRAADPGEHVAVVRLLEGALLDADPETVRERIDRGQVLVAVPEDRGRAVGTLVLDGDHVAAIAVHPSRRRRGIGTALIEAVVERSTGTLTAEFDPDVSGFYERLGFEIDDPDDLADGRLRGRR